MRLDDLFSERSCEVRLSVVAAAVVAAVLAATATQPLAKAADTAT